MFEWLWGMQPVLMNSKTFTLNYLAPNEWYDTDKIFLVVDNKKCMNGVRLFAEKLPKNSCTSWNSDAVSMFQLNLQLTHRWILQKVFKNFVRQHNYKSFLLMKPKSREAQFFFRGSQGNFFELYFLPWKYLSKWIMSFNLPEKQ